MGVGDSGSEKGLPCGGGAMAVAVVVAAEVGKSGRGEAGGGRSPSLSPSLNLC